MNDDSFKGGKGVKEEKRRGEKEKKRKFMNDDSFEGGRG